MSNFNVGKKKIYVIFYWMAQTPVLSEKLAF